MFTKTNPLTRCVKNRLSFLGLNIYEGKPFMEMRKPGDEKKKLFVVENKTLRSFYSRVLI